MADTLATLLRLRHLEADQAKRGLADALASERAAEQALLHANETVRRESVFAMENKTRALAGAFGAWLPAAQAARQAVSANRDAASVQVEKCRSALAGARTAERAVEHARDARTDAAKAAAQRKEQGIMEEATMRRLIDGR